MIDVQKKALTLIEIIVASLVIALTLVGLANLFIVGKRYVLHSRSRISGIELGKVFLEPLQMQVRQDTWDTAANGLSVDPATGISTRFCDNDPAHAASQQLGCPPAAQRVLHGIPYDAEYTVSDVAGTNLRRVQLTIRWQELSI